MRRHDRAVTDMATTREMLSRGTVCHLALQDADGYPYIVPMNYGVTDANDQVSLVFHCAQAGHKLDLLRQNAKAAFSIADGQLIDGADEACKYSYAFESITGHGLVQIVEEPAEKLEALAAIMRQFVPDRAFAWIEQMANGVTVLRLNIQAMTAKRNPNKD